VLLQSKILSPGGVCIAHQPRISLRRMCDRDHLGALGVKEEDILPLELGQMKLIPLDHRCVLVVRRIK